MDSNKYNKSYFSFAVDNSFYLRGQQYNAVDTNTCENISHRNS